MGEILSVEGGRPLYGEQTVQGCKNAALPILAASLLSGETCVLENCPALRDVDASARILRCLGCTVQREGEAVRVDTSGMNGCAVPDALMREMRSSVVFLGAILARQGEAELSYPGGCELGPRPIDQHLHALRALGTEIDECGGALRCRAEHLRGADITLSIPSVGATENAMLAACAASGVTTIQNAAREPEIVDLQRFLTACGASVHGAGGSTITVEGQRSLHGCTHRVMPDRIVAATTLCAAAAAGGEVTLRGVQPHTLAAVTQALCEAGCRVESSEDRIHIRSTGQLKAVRPVRTAPYPGFPTDAQSLLMSALLRGTGATVFIENMFESRYRHVGELLRMGADIRVAGRVAVVSGVERLHGASVRCTDLRGGAALVLAGLCAEGTTRISAVEHIDRGYEHIERSLGALGAQIIRTEETT